MSTQAFYVCNTYVIFYLFYQNEICNNIDLDACVRACVHIICVYVCTYMHACDLRSHVKKYLSVLVLLKKLNKTRMLYTARY